MIAYPFGRYLTLASLFLIVLISIAAAPPEIVRVKVPTAKIGSWFPKGSELVSMPIAEFDELIRKIHESTRGNRANPPLLLQAVHHARLVQEELVGETIFTIRRGAQAGSIALSPFNLTLDSAESKDYQIRATDSGEVSLWVPPAGSSSITIPWRRAASSTSQGRSFSLELPQVGLASIELDIPDDIRPEQFSAIPPTEREPASGRSLWRSLNAAGKVDIRLKKVAEVRASPGSLPWISGPMIIEMGPLSTNWRCEWNVNLNGQRGPLSVTLSDGLEPVDVAGPGVESFQVGRSGDTGRLKIHFRPDLHSLTPIVIRGVAPLSAARTWTVPSARPENGIWIGGTTTVRLDQTYVIENCRILQGRRIVSKSIEPSDKIVLIFEPQRPDPPAELTFADSQPLYAAEVHGLIYASPTRTKLSADIRWTSSQGKFGDLTFDISNDWSIENITQDEEPLAWHQEAVSPQQIRVKLIAPPLESGYVDLTIRIDATRRALPGKEGMELPRIRPVGVATRDDVWVALADSDRRFTPLFAKGVVWVDPALVKSHGFRPESTPTPLDRGLAWRWTGEDGRLVARIVVAPRETKSVIEGQAVIAQGQIRTDWSLSIQPGTQGITYVPVFWTSPPSVPISFRLSNPQGRVQELATRSLTATERAVAGFPGDHGSALAVLLPAQTSDPLALRVAINQTCTGSETIPLLVIADSLHPRSQIRLEIEENLLIQVESTGLEEQESEEITTTSHADILSPSKGRLRTTSLYGYRTADPRLRVTTSPAQHQSANLLVTSAHLSSIFSETGSQSQKLIMVLHCASSQSLTLKMQDQAKVHRITRDGEVVPVTVKGTSLAIPLTSKDRLAIYRLVIEYDLPEDLADLSAGRIYPRLPIINAPCLRFSWRMRLPSSISPGMHGDGLVGNDHLDRADANRLLTWGSPISLREWPLKDGSTIKDLQATVDRVTQELQTNPNVSLSDFLSTLDDGPIPILIDSSGLDELGVKPATRLDWKSGESEISHDYPPRLDQGDLCLISFGTTCIVSNRGGALSKQLQLKTPSFLKEIRSAISTARISGVEPSGRFESVDVWCEPGDPILTEFESHDPLMRGSSVVVLRGNGWPDGSAWLQIKHSTHNQLLSITLALFVLIGGVTIQNMMGQWRGACIVLLASLSIGSIGFGDFLDAWIRVGLCVGGIGVLLLHLAIRVTRSTEVESLTDRSRRSRRTRSVSSSHFGASLVLILLCGGGFSLSARDEVASVVERIVVLLPYEGSPNLEDSPVRVVLQLADLERLRSVIASETRPVSRSPGAIESSHHLTISDQSLAQFSSEFVVVVDGATPVDWKVPIEGAWEIRATVDGHDTPIRIIDEGRAAILRFSGEGQHHLTLHRRVKLIPEGSLLRCELPVNSVPKSRLKLNAPADRSLVVLGGGLARSNSKSGFLEGELGPSQKLAIESRPSTSKVVDHQSSGFSGLALWDARPAGDLVNLRLSATHAEPVSTLRLIVEPGTQLRVPDTRRLTDERWEGSLTSPEWVGNFDPPYRQGEPIELQLWRSVTPTNRPTLERTARRSPTVEVGGTSSFSGVVAFRRPGDWSGRLGARSGFDVIDEEAFVKAWGTLPEEPLTLAGVRGFQNRVVAEVVTGPVRLTRSIRPSLKVELGEGRLDLLLEADIKDERGRSTDLDIDISPNLILDQFTMDGSAGLSRPEAGRLHVDLKPIENNLRKLILRGHLTMASEKPRENGRPYQSPVPWPTWRDATELPGLLTLVTAVKPQLVIGEGITPLSIVDEVVAGSPFPMFRKVYQVNRSSDLGILSWQAAPPIVAAHLLSRLVVDENILRLESTVRYESTGGPLEELFLKVPTVWAKSAEVDLVGHTVQRTTETRGEWTQWTLRPEQPLWGAARLVVRSVREMPIEETFAYPDVIPLGQGSVEKIVSVEQRTATLVEIEGSSGLQSIDFSRVTGMEIVDPVHSHIDAYRVKGDSWGLNLRFQGERKEKRQGLFTVVRTVETDCHLDRTGFTRGRTTLVIDGRRGSLLNFKTADDAEVIWCLVDRRPVLALSEKPGFWSVPIESRGEGIVELFWNLPGSKTASSQKIELPSFSDEDVPTLVRMFSDTGLTINEIKQGLEEIKSPLWMLEKTDRAARRIVAMIARFDRSTNFHELALRTLLTRFARDERQSRHSSAATVLSTPEATQEFRAQIKSRLDRTREVVIESLINNGLDDLKDHLSLASMQSHVISRDDRDLLPSLKGYFSFGEIQDFRSPVVGSGQIRQLEWSVRLHSFWSEITPGLGLMLAGMITVLTQYVLRGRALRLRGLSWGLLICLGVLTVFAPGPGVLFMTAFAIGISHRDKEIRPVTAIV